MPIYEYVCQACEHAFELRQSFEDEPARDCPKCGQPRAKRRISMPGIVFKGSGWYIKDSRRQTVPAGTANGDGAGSGAGSGSGADGETTEKAASTDTSGGATTKGDGAKDNTGKHGSDAGKAARSGGDSAPSASEDGSGAGKSSESSGAKAREGEK